MTRQQYDVAVIGGGLAGLTVAALLGKRGMRVIVLEARDSLGGLTSSEELVPGVTCDIVDHEVGWIPAELADQGGLTPWIPSVTTLVPGGESLTLHPDMQRTAQGLAQYSSRDAEAWPAFAERVARLSGFLQSLYSVPAPSLFATGAGNMLSMLSIGRKARSLGRTGIFDLLRTLPMSIADVLDETFENATLKGLPASRGVTRILQGPKSGATAFLFLHHHVGLPAGAVRTITAAHGGVGRVVSALETMAKSHGAVIRTGARVAQISVRQDRVIGVVLDSGEEINAVRVVSSLDVKRTMHDLIDPEYVEPELSRAISNVRMRGAAAKVNCVLDGPLPVPDELKRNTFVIAPSMEYLERGFDHAKHGAMSAEPFLEIATTDAAGSRGPNEHSAVSVLVQWAPYRLRSGAWEGPARDALGDTVLRTIERVIPGFTARVVQRQVVSPLDIEQRYGASEGSLTHGELALDQILFMRPVPALSRYRSSTIEGLFLCGRGCHPGMPLPAALLAAREVTRAARGRNAEPAQPAQPPAA